MSTEAIAIKHEEDATPASHRDDFMAALSRVLASQAFSRSARLSTFLRHVCVTTLEGREKILCEQHIGTAVFGRPDHYNPSEDTIVRTTARLLRQRLALYYEEEGRHDRFRITMPRGAYVPVCVEATVADAPAAGSAGQALSSAAITVRPDEGAAPGDASNVFILPTPSVPVPSPSQPRRSVLMAAMALVVLALGLAGWRLAGGAVEANASSRFWAAMLPADRDTLVVVSDNGLVMYQGDTHRQVGLNHYLVNRPGLADTPEAAYSLELYGARRYTGMSSVTIAAELGKLATAAPKRLHVSFARDIQLADLKYGNTILVGAEHSNPWWELFRKQFNFHIDWDQATGGFIILNDHPVGGERASYPFSGADPDKRGYALVGFKRSLSGTGDTLFIGGTTSAGTDAGMEFLTTPAFMAPLMKTALRPDGSIREFEVLLQCVLQANGSTDIQVLGTRVK
jgi:hypothetical protein